MNLFAFPMVFPTCRRESLAGQQMHSDPELTNTHEMDLMLEFKT